MAEHQAFSWDHDITLLLLDLISEHYYELQTGVKRQVFEKIAFLLNEQTDMDISAEQCDSKWKLLLKQYHDNKSRNKLKYWNYYSLVENILSKYDDDVDIMAPTSSDQRVSESTKNAETSSSRRAKRKLSESIDEDRITRHKEKIERMDRFLTLYQEMIDLRKSDMHEGLDKRIEVLEERSMERHNDVIQRMDTFLELYKEKETSPCQFCGSSGTINFN